MKIRKITFPTLLSKIEDIENDNVDVIVELEDRNNYTLVVATPQYLLSYMKSQGRNYVEAGSPFVIVEKLTEGIIRKVIETYSDDNAYWLKLYHLSVDFKIEKLDEMIKQQN